MSAVRRYTGVQFDDGTHVGVRIDAKSKEQANWYEGLIRRAVDERMQKISVWPDAMKAAEVKKVFEAIVDAYPRVMTLRQRPATPAELEADGECPRLVN